VGITAKQRATTALRGTTTLAPEAVIEAIYEAIKSVKGGGKSLLTTGIANLGAQVNVHHSSPTSLRLSLSSGKRLVQLGSFSAMATTDSSGRTAVRIGGLESYRTQQQKLFYLIPIGPKQIYGMDPYKRFLNAAMNGIVAIDPQAQLVVAQDA
jgi:hypothetical protein